MANDVYELKGSFPASTVPPPPVKSKYDDTQDTARGIIGRPQSTPSNVIYSAISRSDFDTTADQSDLINMRKVQAIAQTFSEIGQATGGYVQVLPEYHYCPVVIGSNQEAVTLSELVEAIDEFVDFEALCSEYPNLSTAQIMGAISFLRKLSQVNSRQIDLDALEDEQIASDVQLIEVLKQAIADKEIVRVLGKNQ